MASRAPRRTSRRMAEAEGPPDEADGRSNERSVTLMHAAGSTPVGTGCPAGSGEPVGNGVATVRDTPTATESSADGAAPSPGHGSAYGRTLDAANSSAASGLSEGVVPTCSYTLASDGNPNVSGIPTVSASPADGAPPATLRTILSGGSPATGGTTPFCGPEAAALYPAAGATLKGSNSPASDASTSTADGEYSGPVASAQEILPAAPRTSCARGGTGGAAQAGSWATGAPVQATGARPPAPLGTVSTTLSNALSIGTQPIRRELSLVAAGGNDLTDGMRDLRVRMELLSHEHERLATAIQSIQGSMTFGFTEVVDMMKQLLSSVVGGGAPGVGGQLSQELAKINAVKTGFRASEMRRMGRATRSRDVYLPSGRKWVELISVLAEALGMERDDANN